MENKNISQDRMTKPSIELDDFFSYLDPKVVEKIKETPSDSKERISNDIRQYEYDLDGAINILKSI